MNEQNGYPGVKQAIIMVLKVLGLQIFFGLVLEVLSNTLGLNIGLHPSSIAVVNSAAFGIVFLLVKKKINVPWREIFPLKPISLPLLVAILLAVPGEAILCSELDSLTRYLLPVPKFFEEFIVDFAKACANSLWGGILLLILVAPLTEELMFRGIIMGGFLKRYSNWKAILVSSILFACLHVNPWQFITPLLLGILCGWFFLRTRSLVPCLIAHAVLNTLAIVGMTVSVQSDRNSSGANQLTQVQFQPIWLDAFGVVLLGVGIWLFKKYSCDIKCDNNS